jgi:hypothetical protein
VRAVEILNLDTGSRHIIEGRYFLDATELGDLLPLTTTEYVTGAESQAHTGEPSAPAQAQPANQQSFTMPFAMDYLEDEDHTIEKPAEYSFWRDYVPQLRPPWPGKLLSWKMSTPRTLEPRELAFDPTLRQVRSGTFNLWRYRRIADRTNFTPGAYASDITIVNWPQNDYWLGRIIDVQAEEFSRQVERARQLSLSLLYWLQTEAGWKGLRLRRDVAGTEDGLACTLTSANHAAFRPSSPFGNSTSAPACVPVARPGPSPIRAVREATLSTCTLLPAATITSTCPPFRSRYRSGR